MSEGSVLAHVTDANDEADEGGAPLSEQKGARTARLTENLTIFHPVLYFHATFCFYIFYDTPQIMNRFHLFFHLQSVEYQMQL